MSRARTPRAAVLGGTVGALVAGGLAVATPAAAVSPDVRIYEVYGGGGDPGATFTHDYIELFNNGRTEVDLSSWSVQYASATGNSWQVTPLLGTIPAGGVYLVQEAQGGHPASALPVPDASGSIDLSGRTGKVALVTSGTALTCGAATPCTGAAGIHDFVGYGTAASSFEGSGPAPAPSTGSIRRNANGEDTDDNRVDFTVPSALTPANAAGHSVRGEIPPPPPATPARISAIQGTGHSSPLVDTLVGTTGVVTARTANGFWIQDPVGDDDPATSEGLFVVTDFPAAVGAGVSVTGTVTEFRGDDRSTDLTVTRLGDAEVTAGPAAGAVTPTLVGPGGLTPPTTVVDDDGLARFEPATDGADFYESLEGMLLSLEAPQAVGPTTRLGELPVVVGNASVRTARGGIVVRDTDGQVDGSPADYDSGDLNPERIILDDRITGAGTMPQVDVGAKLAGTVLGVLDYGSGNPKLQVTAVPAVAANLLQREQAVAAGVEQLAVATFDVADLDAADPQQSFGDLAAVVVANLKAPDLVALQGIQDDNGPVDDGTVSANRTLDRLVAAIAAAGGPTYRYRQLDPTDRQGGGEPGGNSRVAFLFRTDRGLAFVDRAGGDATTATQVTGAGATTRLTLSPGRVAPTDDAWADSRTPLAGEFTYRGETYFVVADDFAGKGGDDPLYGSRQSPVRSSEQQRHRQAAVLGEFVGRILTADPQANVIALGDLNDFQFSRTMRILEAASGLKNLMDTLPAEERYSYVSDGNSQALDHTLVSPALLAGGVAYDPVHVNSEFAVRVSDHDPQVTLIDTAVAATAVVSDARPLRGDRGTVTGTGFAPGQTVVATLSPGSIALGRGVADAKGTVSITFTVPVLLAEGSHPVDLTATDGEKASTSLTLRPLWLDLILRLLRCLTGGH